MYHIHIYTCVHHCSLANLLARVLACSLARSLACSLVRLLACSLARLLPCSLARLLACLLACLIACLLARLFVGSLAGLIACSPVLLASWFARFCLLVLQPQGAVLRSNVNVTGLGWVGYTSMHLHIAAMRLLHDRTSRLTLNPKH